MVDDNKIGDMMSEKFDTAVKGLIWHKIPVVDDIPSELLIVIGEAVMMNLFCLVCKMYETGKITSSQKEYNNFKQTKCEHVKITELSVMAVKYLHELLTEECKNL